MLIILEEKPGDLQISSVDEYLEFLEVVVDMAGGTILSQEAFESESGQQGVVVTVDIGGVFQAKRMVALQDGVVFNATYLAPADQVEVLWPLAEFSFNSLDSYR